MAIAYDFDMVYAMTHGNRAEIGEIASEDGMVDAMKGRQALFRDPAAVAALQGASDSVKRCLAASGFGIGMHDSGAGPGQFLQSHEKARMAALGKLRLNLRRLPQDADWNGFDIRAFLAAASAARPVDHATPPAAETFRAIEMPSPPPASGGAGSLDDFFTAKPSTARAYAPADDTGPDMDAFFSNTAPARPGTAAAARMTPDDLRMTIDTAPPKKSMFGPVKLVMMAVGLYVVVTVIGSGNGPARLLEAATSGTVVAVQP